MFVCMCVCLFVRRHHVFVFIFCVCECVVGRRGFVDLGGKQERRLLTIMIVVSN